MIAVHDTLFTTLRNSLLVSSLIIVPAYGIVTSDELGSHVVDPSEVAFDMDLDGGGIVGFLPVFNT